MAQAARDSPHEAPTLMSRTIDYVVRSLAFASTGGEDATISLVTEDGQHVMVHLNLGHVLLLMNYFAAHAWGRFQRALGQVNSGGP